MTQYTLPRTGQRPLRFEGDSVVEASGAWGGSGRDQTRYHVLTVYRTTDDGRHIVHIHYRSHWQGETDDDQVVIVQTADEAVAVLEAHDPTEPVIGYRTIVERHSRGSQHDEYARRQSALLEDITRRYQALLAEVFEKLGVVEDLQPGNLDLLEDESERLEGHPGAPENYGDRS